MTARISANEAMGAMETNQRQNGGQFNSELEVEHFAKWNIKFVAFASVLDFPALKRCFRLKRFVVLRNETRESLICSGRLAERAKANTAVTKTNFMFHLTKCPTSSSKFTRVNKNTLLSCLLKSICFREFHLGAVFQVKPLAGRLSLVPAKRQ